MSQLFGVSSRYILTTVLEFIFSGHIMNNVRLRVAFKEYEKNYLLPIERSG
jgi:hypothetical protein